MGHRLIVARVEPLPAYGHNRYDDQSDRSQERVTQHITDARKVGLVRARGRFAQVVVR